MLFASEVASYRRLVRLHHLDTEIMICEMNEPSRFVLVRATFFFHSSEVPRSSYARISRVVHHPEIRTPTLINQLPPPPPSHRTTPLKRHYDHRSSTCTLHSP